MEFSLHLPLSVKMQGNEVEAVKTPTVRSWEIYWHKIYYLRHSPISCQLISLLNMELIAVNPQIVRTMTLLDYEN
jgi:hypothetical protein